MKALDVQAVVRESMTHYLESKAYNSETFINYVARDTRAHGDKFNNEDRSICKKVAQETIEKIVERTVVKMLNVNEYPFDFILIDPETDKIIGHIDDYDIELNCDKGVEFRHLTMSKRYIKRKLTKAFIG